MMISSTIVSLLLLSSLLLVSVDGLAVSEKRPQIPMNTRVHFDDQSIQIHDKVIERRKRLSPKPLPDDNAAINAAPTVMVNENFHTTTVKSMKAFEAKDMRETSVTPKDDDDITTVPKSTVNAKTTVAPVDNVTSLNKAMKAKKNITKTPPDEFPAKSAKSLADLPRDEQNRLNHYKVDNETINATGISKIITPLLDIVEVAKNEPTTSASARKSSLLLESREKIVESADLTVSQTKTDNTGMPAGVVAVISAIGFAMIAVIAYVGLIVWRRYQEYIHGNRELLVNDFDANDINNFEL